jgi:hypothetical protein
MQQFHKFYYYSTETSRLDQSIKLGSPILHSADEDKNRTVLVLFSIAVLLDSPCSCLPYPYPPNRKEEDITP